MKKTGLKFFLILTIMMIILYPNTVIGINTAAVEISPFVQDLPDDPGNESETDITPDNTLDNTFSGANQEQTNSNRNLSGLNENPGSTQVVNPRPQPGGPSAETASSLNSTTNDTGASTDNNIIINSLPEMPASEEPDTLSKLINWWSVNPLGMKFWYLFLILSTVLFLYRLTSFRKPLLFISLVIFGFYFANTVNPINSIFSIPVQTGEKLINSIIIVAIPIGLSLLVGRSFCGWACPVGAVQEFIHPEKLAFQLPPLVDGILSSLRFILLIGGIIFSWSALTNIWNNIDPFQGLFTFKWSIIPAILLLVVLAASMLIERFYCRYLCPLGAVLAITSRLSPLKLGADSELCIACGKCSQPKACPMEVIFAANPYTDLPRIKTAECIVCYRCGDICRYSALKLSVNKRKKRTKGQNSEQTPSF